MNIYKTDLRYIHILYSTDVTNHVPGRQ